jgi:hypothetical protein
MTEEHDSYLVTKYPQTFADRHASMQETAMCWGFECGDGWFNIIDHLCESIQGYIDNNDKAQVVATQVKEKYGTLRFYYNGGDDLTDGMVWLAEVISHHTCEMCGTTQDVKSDSVYGWILTLCPECREKKLI